MRVEDTNIDEIIVANRRREEFGDIEGLASSIAKFGLFHPIVVDDENNLIAGERRLLACQSLGWTKIPCRMYAELTEAERLEIELDENLKRKDLTPYEASKRILQDAEKIEEIISTNVVEKDSRGRKSERAVPKKDVAQAIGTSTSNLVRAEQHVSAVESYPELKTAPQKQAIETAKTLDRLPEAKREEVRKDASRLKQIVSRPPIPRPSKHSPLSPVQEFIHNVKSKGGALSFCGRMSEVEVFSFLDSLRNCHEEIGNFVAEIQDHLDEQSAIAS